MTVYDELPYPSYAYPQTHPDRLATVARIYGLRAPDVRTARVLEIGCAAGGNLMPMAEALPEARFLGIDLSRREIDEGRAQLSELGLANLELREQDLLALGPGIGTFDYVIAHGLFSWVPRPVQDKLLDVLRDHLAPEGVAYVSYNTWPGWYAAMPVRTMVLRHTRGEQDPQRRLAIARELLRRVAESSPVPQLRNECREYLGMADGQLLHDLMATPNEPLWFPEFVARAQARGLAYLADAELGDTADFSPLAARVLAGSAAPLLERELQLDELRCNRFRRTLLRHGPHRDAAAPATENLRDLWFHSRLRPETDGGAADGKQSFVNGEGARLTIDNAVGKAALTRLCALAPRAEEFTALLAQARAETGSRASVATDQQALAELLLGCLAARLVDAHTWPPQFVLAPGPRPLARKTARLQARTSTIVTSGWHQMVDLGREEGRCLLTLLDGTRDRAALARELAARFPQAGGSEQLEQMLLDLGSIGLLIA